MAVIIITYGIATECCTCGCGHVVLPFIRRDPGTGEIYFGIANCRVLAEELYTQYYTQNLQDSFCL